MFGLHMPSPVSASSAHRAREPVHRDSLSNRQKLPLFQPQPRTHTNTHTHERQQQQQQNSSNKINRGNLFVGIVSLCARTLRAYPRVAPQVDLGQLHALLATRFDRPAGDSSLGGNTAPSARIPTQQGGEQREVARAGGRCRPDAQGAAATAAPPRDARRETTTNEGHGGSGHWSLGMPGRSQPRAPRLAGARKERGSDGGKNERRAPSGRLNHEHPRAGAKEGGNGSSDGLGGREQQGWVGAPDPPPAAAAAAATTAKAVRKDKSAAFPAGAAADGRKAAATRVQAVFRGHKGRNSAAAEGRKRARRLAAEREAREEQQRPSAAACRRRGGRISRPKGPSTYGF